MVWGLWDGGRKGLSDKGCVPGCTGELGGESAFLLLVVMGPGIGKVRVRFGIVLRLPARKTLDIGGREGVECAFGVLVWVPLGAWCVDGLGGVLWMGILGRFARGEGEGVAMPLCPCV